MIEIARREEIDNQYKWKVEKLYADAAAWEQDMEQLKQMLPQGERFRGHLADSAEMLFACIHWQEQTGMLLEKLYLYASLRHDEDTANPLYQGLNERIQSVAVAYSQAMAFFSPEVLAIPEQVLESYLQHPDLRPYRRLFDDITRMRPHTLSPAEEQLLAGTAEMAESFSNTYGMLTNADMPLPAIRNEQGEEERLSSGNYIRFLRSSDRRVRKDAFCAMYNGYAAFGNTIASTLSGSVRKDNFYAAAGRYDSALAASLFGDNVEESVYHNLIQVVRAHQGDMERYLQRRRQLLQVDELHMYDIYVPLFPDYRRQFDWEQARIW